MQLQGPAAGGRPAAQVVSGPCCAMRVPTGSRPARPAYVEGSCCPSHLHHPWACEPRSSHTRFATDRTLQVADRRGLPLGAFLWSTWLRRPWGPVSRQGSWLCRRVQGQRLVKVLYGRHAPLDLWPCGAVSPLCSHSAARAQRLAARMCSERSGARCCAARQLCARMQREFAFVWWQVQHTVRHLITSLTDPGSFLPMCRHSECAGGGKSRVLPTRGLGSRCPVG